MKKRKRKKLYIYVLMSVKNLQIICLKLTFIYKVYKNNNLNKYKWLKY